MESEIVTLTMNPAIDESASAERLVPDLKMRCRDTVQEPGGGGVNVARALRRLGGDARAIYPRGGATGELLERLLDAEGVHQSPIAIRGWTRRNFNVLETATGRQYRFVLPGPELSEHEWRRCLAAIERARPAPSYVVASGSLPPGVPADFYAQLAEIANRRQARFVLDCSGEPLRLAVQKPTFLLKSSLREFGGLIGEEVSADSPDLAARAMRLIRTIPCGALVLSLGPAGALLVTRDSQERIPSPAVPVRSSVGAGDAMVAGIVRALSIGWPLAAAFRYGVAAGAAAVMNPGTQLCRREDTEALYASLSGLEVARPGAACSLPRENSQIIAIPARSASS
jgi:6-phosphofructokinase 2